jgi:hypothetical protein
MTDPCTIALEIDKKLMQIHNQIDEMKNEIMNPYVETLVESGYDRQDVEVASTMFQKKKFPCVIHGRTFETEEQYYQELYEYMNGM